LPRAHLRADHDRAARRPAELSPDEARDHRRAAAAPVHARRRDPRPRLRLPAVHGAADLRLGGAARHALRRGRARPRGERRAGVPPRGPAADAAGRDRRLHPRVHPDDRRVRHARPDGRHARADDRQPHPQPVRGPRERTARQRGLDGAAGPGLRGRADLHALGPGGRPVTAAAARPGARDAAAIDPRPLRRDLALRGVGRALLWLSPFVVYLFLWAPIVVLVVFSFNDGASVSVWNGFTTRWYENILNNTITAGTEAARFQTGLLLRAVRNSL